AAIRGFIWRKRIKQEGEKELVFLGMKPKIKEAKNLMRRKRIQLEHTREYEEKVVELKQKVGVTRSVGPACCP
ncbi:ATPase_AAA_core domain-containing protein, partial [Haematococcus lacustris]